MSNGRSALAFRNDIGMLDDPVERLRADDITGQCYDLTGPFERSGNVLWVPVQGRGQEADLVPDLLRGHLDVLVPGHRLEHQVALDGTQGMGPGVGPEPQLVEPLGVEHLLESQAGLLGALPRVPDPMLSL